MSNRRLALASRRVSAGRFHFSSTDGSAPAAASAEDWSIFARPAFIAWSSSNGRYMPMVGKVV